MLATASDWSGQGDNASRIPCNMSHAGCLVVLLVQPSRQPSAVEGAGLEASNATALASFPTPAANRHDHEPHHQLIAKNLIVSYITASTSDVPLLDQCLGFPEGAQKQVPAGDTSSCIYNVAQLPAPLLQLLPALLTGIPNRPARSAWRRAHLIGRVGIILAPHHLFPHLHHFF